LSRLVERTEETLKQYMPTVVSHANALITVVSQAVQDAGDPICMQLAEELEELVSKELSN
jgi:hypothetical protein